MEVGHPTRARERAHELGEGAIEFASWYTRSRFTLMERFLEDLETSPGERDLPALRRRFLHAVRHAKRVVAARGVVTFLLALGAIATAATALVGVLYVPSPLQTNVVVFTRLLGRAAAVSGSATVILLVLRLAFDRYVDLLDTCATFLAMQLASGPSTTRRGA